MYSPPSIPSVASVDSKFALYSPMANASFMSGGSTIRRSGKSATPRQSKRSSKTPGTVDHRRRRRRSGVKTPKAPRIRTPSRRVVRRSPTSATPARMAAINAARSRRARRVIRRSSSRGTLRLKRKKPKKNPPVNLQALKKKFNF